LDLRSFLSFNSGAFSSAAADGAADRQDSDSLAPAAGSGVAEFSCSIFFGQFSSINFPIGYI
jgi:hypothetical protein